jgi:hypothetical protein
MPKWSWLRTVRNRSKARQQLSTLLAWLSICARCVSPQSAVEHPPIDQLLIDESPFPQGWEASDPDADFPPPAPWTTARKEVEYIDRTYHTLSERGGRAFIRIQRFGNSRAAADEYADKADIAFREGEWNTPWIVPAGLAFESTVADQYRYACSMEGPGELAWPVCAYVAQYGVYALEFYIDFYDTSVITHTDVLPIFQAIDERMEEHLGEG